MDQAKRKRRKKLKARRQAKMQVQPDPVKEQTPEERFSALADGIGWRGDMTLQAFAGRFIGCRPSAFLQAAGPEGLLFPGFWQAVRSLVEYANQKRPTLDQAPFIKDARREVERVCQAMTARPGVGKFLTDADSLLFEFNMLKAEGLTPGQIYREIAKMDKDRTPASVKRAVSKARKERGLSRVTKPPKAAPKVTIHPRE